MGIHGTHDNVLHDASYTTYRVRRVRPSLKKGEELHGTKASDSATAPLVARWGSWILTLLYFIGQAVAQGAWTTPYSLIDNRVSDLGNTACGRTLANTYICSPLHAVMNTTFVLTGVLILVGLFLTRSIWPQRRLTTWALIFWESPAWGQFWWG